jgi:DNA invertase Pin-like site-specific DNA recombinase
MGAGYMNYAYMIENQGVEDNRDNSKLIKLIRDLEIEEEYVFIEEDATNKEALDVLLNTVQQEDRLLVETVKDLALDIRDLLFIFEQLDKKAITLCSVEESFLSGRDYYAMLGGLKNLSQHYTNLKKQKGYEKAVQEKRVGRPAKDEGDLDKAIRLYETKAFKIDEIEKLTGVSSSTLYRALKKL